MAQCRATYEDAPMNSHFICSKVTSKVQLHTLAHIPSKPSLNNHRHIIETLRIRFQPSQTRRGRWCKWDKPSPGWFKLNIDGSAKDDESAGGGIIRDEDGVIVAAFSHFYGAGSNNMAEFIALKDGMMLCNSLNISLVLIESDSLLVVTALRMARIENWRFNYVLRDCLVLYSPSFEIVHGVR